MWRRETEPTKRKLVVPFNPVAAGNGDGVVVLLQAIYIDICVLPILVQGSPLSLYLY